MSLLSTSEKIYTINILCCTPPNFLCSRPTVSSSYRKTVLLSRPTRELTSSFSSLVLGSLLLARVLWRGSRLFFLLVPLLSLFLRECLLNSPHTTVVSIFLEMLPTPFMLSLNPHGNIVHYSQYQYSSLDSLLVCSESLSSSLSTIFSIGIIVRSSMLYSLELKCLLYMLLF